MTEKTPPTLLGTNRVICLMGKRFCGKTTVEKVIMEINGPNTASFALAEGFKRYYARLMGLDEYRLFHDRLYKEQHRVAMTEECWRVLKSDPDAQINTMIESLKYHSNQDPSRLLIVSDLRMWNDALRLIEVVGRHRCLFVRIECEADLKTARGWVFTPEIDLHPSETDLDQWIDLDVCVRNNGTQEQLKEQVGRVVRRALRLGSPPSVSPTGSRP